MPNTFAYAMLLIWPMVAVYLFKRLSPTSTIIWTLVAGYLYLPSKTAIDLPLLPAINKTSVPALTVLILCLIGVGAVQVRRTRGLTRSAAGRAATREFKTAKVGWLPRSPLVKLLIATFVFSLLVTVMFNSDVVQISSTATIKALGVYDAVAMIFIKLIAVIPFVIGCRYLRTTDSHRTFLQIMVAAGLYYTIFMLFELRFSPQVHKLIYGFFPHAQFNQSIRFGGYRPVVFLEHGLRVALFISMMTVAAVTLLRVKDPAYSARRRFAAPWLAVMLLMCKSIGALAVTVIFAPLLLCGRKAQMFTAAMIALVVILYPMVRGTGLVPIGTVLELAETVNKAGSLSLRLTNEDQLLERASERPIFGWGNWGRARIYDEESGRDLSVTDGVWAIVIGEYGWVGYIALFGLLGLPSLAIWRKSGRPDLSLETTGISLIMMINLVDLIPNSSLTPITWLMAGALLGRAEDLTAAPPVEPVAIDDPAPEPRGGGRHPVRPGARPDGQARPRPAPAAGLVRGAPTRLDCPKLTTPVRPPRGGRSHRGRK